jgi:hypothetical protein
MYLSQQHIHKLEDVLDGLGPSMVIEVNPNFCSLYCGLIDAMYPWVKLLLHIKVVISIEPVVLFLFLLTKPDISVPPMKANIVWLAVSYLVTG